MPRRSISKVFNKTANRNSGQRSGQTTLLPNQKIEDD